MINGEAIVAQVQHGTWPQNWQVLRAKPSHFIRLAIFVAIFFVAAAGGLIFLLGHPSDALTLGAAGSSDGGALDPAAFSLWRTVDFTMLGLVLAGLTVALVRTLVQAAQAHEQLLVLLPEGFVLKTGRAQAFDFGSMQTLSAVSTNGVVALRMVALDGQQSTVQLDTRFGSSTQLAKRILTARNQFVAARGSATPRGA
ncbi:MAG TPA: hypothetical protein VGP82_00800 [Ktedonobacterales bacterium]|jgi:hypothetical protein|nr:hypothetical protein [Ktedonobacterales bacterium]